VERCAWFRARNELGYRVVAEAAGGRETISLARQLHPDLVLMDVKTPNVDGLEAAKQIDRPRICPIVLLTAHSDRALVRRACSLSAILAYLVKPVTARDLEPAIELAVHHFQRIRELQRETARPDHSLDAHTPLERARVPGRTSPLLATTSVWMAFAGSDGRKSGRGATGLGDYRRAVGLAAAQATPAASLERPVAFSSPG
jgi:response regulator NasT